MAHVFAMLPVELKSAPVLVAWSIALAFLALVKSDCIDLWNRDWPASLTLGCEWLGALIS